MAFEMAASLGYDGVEVMVWTDPVSQDIDRVEDLAERHGCRCSSIHAPCLLITQRVWSPDPWERLTRSVEPAADLGAPTVVVHPPFRWQRDYARGFVDGVADLEKETGVAIAVENMYPWRAAGREIAAYAPDWDPTDERLRATTRSTCRTPQCPARTPWPWPTPSATGSPTSTSPTAPARRATSTWSPAAATSHVPSCSSGSRSAGGRGAIVLEVARGGRGRRTSGRPTWPRPWRSRGSTWPPRWSTRPSLSARRHRRAGAPRVRTVNLPVIMSTSRPFPRAEST